MLSFLEFITDLMSELFPDKRRRWWFGVLVPLGLVVILVLLSVFTS